MPFCTPRTCDKLHYRHRKSLSLSMERIGMFWLYLFLGLQDICLRNVQKDFLFVRVLFFGGNTLMVFRDCPCQSLEPGSGTCKARAISIVSSLWSQKWHV